MSQPTANIAPKVHFLVRHKQKNKPDQTYDIQSRMGDEGRTLVIAAEAAVRYELRDQATQRGAEKVRAKRVGVHLHIYLEGSESPDVIVENYFDEAIVQFPSENLTGISSHGDLGVYVIDQGLRPALITLQGEIAPIVLIDPFVWASSWAFAVGGGLLAATALLGSKLDTTRLPQAPALWPSPATPAHRVTTKPTTTHRP